VWCRYSIELCAVSSHHTKKARDDRYGGNTTHSKSTAGPGWATTVLHPSSSPTKRKIMDCLFDLAIDDGQHYLSLHLD
jgi:hypothetical protein